MVLLVVTATALGDQTRAHIGHRVLVATVERMLPGDILRGAGVPVGGGHLGRRGRRPEPDRYADHVGRSEAVDQRGGMRVVHSHRPPTSVDRLLVGHGGLGHSGGADLSAHNEVGRVGRRFRRVRDRRRRRFNAVSTAVRRRGVRLQRIGWRARVPVDAGRRTVARLRASRGRRISRVVRVRAHVHRAQSVPVPGSVEQQGRRGRRFGGRRVCRVRRRVFGHGRVRPRLFARNARQTVSRDQRAFFRSADSSRQERYCGA